MIVMSPKNSPIIHEDMVNEEMGKPPDDEEGNEQVDKEKR